MNNILFGIDLGTTNSAIAKYDQGQVTLFKNPVGFKDTLPSVVSFKKNRILIGDKARELIKTQSENVCSSFKRKMGSDNTFFVPDMEKNISPIELSSLVLQELRSFVQDEKPKSAVVTIPASFDTIQSNATKKAGLQAGFDEIVLLQEPIAACLAYANIQNLDISQPKKWLVYDFGGGTFDVALVNIDERALEVVDHKGNNFLGGLDLDMDVLQKLICPKIEKETGFSNLWEQMVNGQDVLLKRCYYEWLLKVEEAKKELSIKPYTTLEIDVEDKNWFFDISITQEEFNTVIQPKFEASFHFITQLINDNFITFQDIERIILVGGTTYIPYIRQQLAERTSCLIDSSVDPTTAVVVGAAFYAGSKNSSLVTQEMTPQTTSNPTIDVQLIFEPHSKDIEELLIVSLKENLEGFYRITRADGAFDTGILPLKNKISEFLTLLPKTNNQFTLQILDLHKNVVYTNNQIRISHGLYAIAGQPLPNDICLELDESREQSYLEPIFKKNELLPLKKTLYKTSSKTILKNSDDSLIINIVEGTAGNMIGSNLSIGYIEISGKQLGRDLLKGMDIELQISISESRDLKINVYIGALDLEINEVFTPSERSVSVLKLENEIKNVLREIQAEINQEIATENYEYLGKIKSIEERLLDTLAEVKITLLDVETDKKFQLDERKRGLIQEFDDMVRHKHVIEELNEYMNNKGIFEEYREKASPKQIADFEKIIQDEKHILASANKYLIRKKAKQIEQLIDHIYLKQDERFIDYFYYFRFLEESKFSNASKVQSLIEIGTQAIEKNNLHELKAVCNQLYGLLKEKPKNTGFEDNFDGSIGLK